MRRICKLIALLIALIAFGLIAWWWPGPKSTEPRKLSDYNDTSRHSLLIADERTGEKLKTLLYLDQGWKPRESMDFYTRAQGSRLLPYAFFLALEQPKNQKLFRDPKHLARFGYLPQKANPFNPDALPVGFVKDPANRGESTDWLGLTCAACHTAQIHYKSHAFRIDGGPTMGDLDTLLREMTSAMKATLDDAAKFDRFARRALGKRPSSRAKAQLNKQLLESYEIRRYYNEVNRVKHPYGYARLDAFGRILNQVLVTHLDIHDKAQKHAPDAPVSYPHLWDTPHHDYVQWNGIARNKILGSDTLGGLARNVGQVLGVFGQVRISRPRTASVFTGYQSSARIPDLVHLEKLLRKLQSPKWPKQLPAIDEAKRSAGKNLGLA